MADITINANLCIAAGAIFPPMTLLLVGTRFYAKKVQNNRIGVDDWLTVPSLMLVIGMSIAMLVVLIKTGVGNHSVGYPSPLPPSGQSEATTSTPIQHSNRKILWSIELMQIPALAATKASFIFFYRRIFSKGTGPVFRSITTLMLMIILIWCLGFFFSFLFICDSSPDAYWISLLDEKEQCVNTTILHNAYAISDFIIDVFVIAMPVPSVLRLQMATSRKLAVLAVFGLGAFSVAASTIRLVTYIQSTQVEFEAHTDLLLIDTNAMYWSLVESGFALISACLPTVQAVFKQKLLSSLRYLTSSRGGDDKNSLSRSVLRWEGDHKNRDAEPSNIELQGRVHSETDPSTSEDAVGAESQVFTMTPAETGPKPFL